MNEAKRFGKALKALLNEPAVYGHFLDEQTGFGTWTAGGCGGLGVALVEWLGPKASLWAVYDDIGVLHHVVVRVGDWFLDGDGVARGRTILRRAEEWEFLPEPTLEPFVPVACEFVWDSYRKTEDLVGLLEDRFGAGGAVARILERS